MKTPADVLSYLSEFESSFPRNVEAISSTINALDVERLSLFFDLLGKRAFVNRLTQNPIDDLILHAALVHLLPLIRARAEAMASGTP